MIHSKDFGPGTITF